MRQLLSVLALSVLLVSCSNQPDRPAEYQTPEGDHWVISFVSSGVSGSLHLYINSERVASGSFGAIAGNKASGGGTFRDQQITFHCAHRYRPDCLVYADGKLIADMKYSAEE